MSVRFLKVIAAREMCRAGRKWEQGVNHAPIDGKVKPEAFSGDPNFTVEVVNSMPEPETKKKEAE